MILRLELLLCVIGWHWWSYMCADRDAPRRSMRECRRCSLIQTRDYLRKRWA